MLWQDPSITHQRSEEISADWKLANIISTCKKNMREDPGNDRPVTEKFWRRLYWVLLKGI